MDLILHTCESISVIARKLLDGDALEEQELRDFRTHMLQCSECNKKFLTSEVRKHLEMLYHVSCNYPSWHKFKPIMMEV